MLFVINFNQWMYINCMLKDMLFIVSEMIRTFEGNRRLYDNISAVHIYTL